MLSVFKEILFDKYNEKTADVRKNNSLINKEIETLKQKKSKVITLMTEECISVDDGKTEITKINEQITEKEGFLSSDDKKPNLEECWSLAKYFINNVDVIWEKAELDLKQRIQGLIIPSGFHFQDNLIKPLKNPYLLGIFNEKMLKSQMKGG